MAKEQYIGTGRRKSAIARVRLIPGSGKIVINKKDLDEYLPMDILRNEVKRPFEVTGCVGKFDVIALVNGGGMTGQAGALRHGISRALCEADSENRPALKAYEGKKEVRTQESKKSSAVLKEIVREIKSLANVCFKRLQGFFILITDKEHNNDKRYT